MSRHITSISVTTAAILVLIIGLLAANQLGFPIKDSLKLPIYSGELWCISDDYLAYVSLEGTISEADFPMIFPTIKSTYQRGSEKVTWISVVKIYTLVTSNGDRGEPYYLVDCGHRPVYAVSREYDELRDEPNLWVFGHMFRYRGPDNETYTMLDPIEIHTEPVSDLVALAEEVLVEEVGRIYFLRHFSDPQLNKEFFDDLDWKYIVSYKYKIKIGDYEKTTSVYIYFDENREPISTEGIPLEGNRIPFSVNRDEAIKIAEGAGLRAEYGPFIAEIIYIGNWDWAENETPAFQGRYVWSVSVWLDDPDTSPSTRQTALIDVKTGRLYNVKRLTFVAIPTTD